jgi:hypothetical protein
MLAIFGIMPILNFPAPGLLSLACWEALQPTEHAMMSAETDAKRGMNVCPGWSRQGSGELGQAFLAAELFPLPGEPAGGLSLAKHNSKTHGLRLLGLPSV